MAHTVDEKFTQWYQIRYGVTPSKKQTKDAYPLWKWSRKQKRKHFRCVKTKVVNRHIAAKRLAA